MYGSLFLRGPIQLDRVITRWQPTTKNVMETYLMGSSIVSGTSGKSHALSRWKSLSGRSSKMRCLWGENLLRRGIHTEVNCPRCNETESPMHTFFSFFCMFAKKVWECIPLKETIHIVVTDTFKAVTNQLRTATSLPSTGVPNTILTWVCWLIWKDRNLLIFEGKSAHHVDLASEGLALAREWSEAKVCTPQGQIHHTISQLNMVMRVPQPGLQIFVCKTYAAWDRLATKYVSLGF